MAGPKAAPGQIASTGCAEGSIPRRSRMLATACGCTTSRGSGGEISKVLCLGRPSWTKCCTVRGSSARLIRRISFNKPNRFSPKNPVRSGIPARNGAKAALSHRVAGVRLAWALSGDGGSEPAALIPAVLGGEKFPVLSDSFKYVPPDAW